MHANSQEFDKLFQEVANREAQISKARLKCQLQEKELQIAKDVGKFCSEEASSD
jgi:hypothetical protein